MEVELQSVNETRNILENVRMPFPWENVPRVCLNCGYRGSGKNSRRLLLQYETAMKCPKCGKKKFIKDPAVAF